MIRVGPHRSEMSNGLQMTDERYRKVYTPMLHRGVEKKKTSRCMGPVKGKTEFAN